MTAEVVWKGPPQLRDSLVAIDSLDPWPDNPNHGDVAEIAGSLKRFGQLKNVVVEGSRIVAGHHIVLAALELGWTHVAVFDGEFADEEEARAFLLADNQIPRLGTIDEEALAIQMAALRSFEGTGFSDADRKALTARLAALRPSADDADALDPPDDPRSELGAVYELGPHRLMCGDAREPEAMATLMGGALAEVLWTDPPYGVSYVGKTRDKLTIKNDGAEGLEALLDAAFASIDTVLAPNARFYVAAPAGPKGCTFQQSIDRVGWRLHQVLVWVKDVMVLGHSDYHYQHEDILYGWKPGPGRPGRGRHAGSRWYGGHDKTSVFRIDRPKRSEEHPCLLPGEFVLTDEGYEAIDALEVGRLVYSDDGMFHPVTLVHSAPCDGHVYEIDVDGTNLTTKATGNHPFLTWRTERRGSRIVGGYVDWIPADELVPGDYLLTPVAQCVPESVASTADWWFAAGLWCAEGSVHTNQHGGAYASYTIGDRKQHLLERLRATFGTVGVYQREGASQAVVMQKGLVEQFVALVDRGAVSKRIRPAVLAADEGCRQSFLDGYLSGDGCIVRGAYRAKTASLRLASTLPLLIESLGTRAAMYRHDASGRPAPRIRGREIKQGVYYALYLLKGSGRKPLFIEHEGRSFSMRRVSSVKPIPYTGPVWNLTVEGRHTFQTAVGMSHNTMKPVELIWKQLVNSAAAGDVVLDAFAGSGSTLLAADQLGARCFAMELDPGYCDVVIARWERTSGGEARRV